MGAILKMVINKKLCIYCTLKSSNDRNLSFILIVFLLIGNVKCKKMPKKCCVMSCNGNYFGYQGMKKNVIDGFPLYHFSTNIQI